MLLLYWPLAALQPVLLVLALVVVLLLLPGVHVAASSLLGCQIGFLLRGCGRGDTWVLLASAASCYQVWLLLCSGTARQHDPHSLCVSTLMYSTSPGRS
jgi:hypothetical protein